jgi:GTPase
MRDILADIKVPLIVAVNKIDSIEKNQLMPVLQSFQNLISPHAIVPLSALTGDNCECLIPILTGLMPEEFPFFPADEISDRPVRFFTAEIIREHAIKATYQELPHAVAVQIESFKEDLEKSIVHISATFYVEKNSQKGILIGKNGSMLKQIGSEARKELEAFLDMRVDLQLWVKVDPNWRKNPGSLRKFGIIEK